MIRVIIVINMAVALVLIWASAYALLGTPS